MSNSVSRKLVFVKIKGRRPKPKRKPDDVDGQQVLVGEPARRSAPMIMRAHSAAATSRSGLTLGQGLLLAGLVIVLVGLAIMAVMFGDRPRVDGSSAAGNAMSGERRRQIGGDFVNGQIDTGSRAAQQGNITGSAASTPYARAVPTPEGFLAAPLKRGVQSPGDFNRTTCAVQSGGLSTESVRLLQQCIDAARKSPSP